MENAAAIHARQSVPVAALGRYALAVGTFLSGFVLYEPAPYELFMAGLIGLWFLFGLKISRSNAILMTILMVFNAGGILSLTVMSDISSDIVLYLGVSFFLAISAVFFAAVIEDDATRLKTIFNAYLAGTLATGLLGILGYFNILPASELFTLYDRAKGAFQDPNVFGPYLVLPACFLLHNILAGKLASSAPRLFALSILTLAIFLSFSRAAWGLYGLSILMLVFFMLLNERSTAFRMRIFIISICGILLMAITIGIALQFEQVSNLFFVRAQLVQEYDIEQLGRFDRYRLGFLLAMERPLGVGPMAFGKLFHQDPHNIWLKALMAYGWLGFLAYATLVVWTLVAGFKCLLRPRTWQPYFLCAYIVFLGHILISTIIDTDHWRHFYILLGIIWGCIGLEARYMRQRQRGASSQFA